MTRTINIFAILATALMVLGNHRAESTINYPATFCVAGPENSHQDITAVVLLSDVSHVAEIGASLGYMPATMVVTKKKIIVPIMKELPFY